jgi:hypothetical protein
VHEIGQVAIDTEAVPPLEDGVWAVLADDVDRVLEFPEWVGRAVLGERLERAGEPCTGGLVGGVPR